MTHPIATLVRRALVLLPCAVMLTFALACEYGTSGAGAFAPTAPAVGLTPKLGVSPDSVSLQVGAFEQLQVTLIDVNGKAVDDPAVTWSADDPAIATVDAQGIVLAMAPGLTTITASYGEELTAFARVLVLPAEARRLR